MTNPKPPNESEDASTPPATYSYKAWENKAHDYLVSEMRKRRLSYKALAHLLEARGIAETPDQLNRKVNRKRFSAAFFLACLEAIKSAPTREAEQRDAAKTAQR